MATTIFLSIFLLAHVLSASCADYSSDPTIQLFREYVQINTTTNGDLTAAVDFWKAQAAALNLTINAYEFDTGYPVVVIKWPGTDSTLGSVMLNSHIDVVPADEPDWTYPPFAAHLDEEGFIFGRGTQDVKSVSIQYFEALKRLTQNNGPLLRDVYITLMPDEETGGQHGMTKFLVSQEFAAMNVAVEMDEGTSSPIPQYALFYRDKDAWQIKIDCYGQGGHSSNFYSTETTATGKCTKFINTITKFRDEQFVVAERATILNAGAYTSVNLNILQAGTANNIIPDHVSLIFDIRLASALDVDTLDAQLNQWVKEAGDNVTLTYILKNPKSPGTIIDPSNPWFLAIAQAAQTANITVVPIVAPGSTDARYVRLANIPAFGFSPLHNTPLLLHMVDERVNAEIFLEGISIYENIISSLANVPAESVIAGMAYVAV